MAQREPDYEAVILQKLKTMEYLLRLFMANLEGLPQKRGRGSFPVYAPIAGEIVWEWYQGDVVKEDWLLCTIYGGGGVEMEVDSPAEGQLSIITRRFCGRGDKIATIETDVLV